MSAGKSTPAGWRRAEIEPWLWWLERHQVKFFLAAFLLLVVI